MVPFQKICPRLAMPEQRSIRLEGTSNECELPSDEYALIESYCQERGCNCRRVILTVMSVRRGQVEATISFDFDPKGSMPGPFLDPINRQGEHAEEILELVTELLRRDADYVARLKRHCQIAKDIQDGRLRPEEATPSSRLPAPSLMPSMDASSKSAGRRRRGGVRSAPFKLDQDLGDEYDEDRVMEYIEGLTRRFESSPEAHSLVEQDASIVWASTMMHYSIQHLGLRPFEMSVADHNEVVFDLFPRKVSTDPESAEEIVTELRAFWQFMQREYGLGNAARILGELGADAVGRLEDKLANPRSFGMAKSFFRMGELSGFDMSTPEGLAELTRQYNRQQSAGRDQSGPQFPTRPDRLNRLNEMGTQSGFDIPAGERSKENRPVERQQVRDAKKRQRQAKKRNRR